MKSPAKTAIKIQPGLSSVLGEVRMARLAESLELPMFPFEPDLIDVALKGREGLLRIRGFGDKTVRKISAVLRAHGLWLRD